MDAAVLFFVLGVVARLGKSDLKLPGALYEALSVFLLLSIGLKGGVELNKFAAPALIPHAIGAVLLGCIIPPLAFAILRWAGGMARPDAGAIAGHYGSVSVVTYAVASAYLAQRGIGYEGHMGLLLVLMEMPGIVVGVMLARSGAPGGVAWAPLLREVMLSKSIVLLAGGLVIGAIAGQHGIEPLAPFFFTLFKGALCLFLLEMGLVAAGQIDALKRAGVFLAGFGIVMPLLSALLALATGAALGMSAGGTALLATLAASASYIAAPAAMRLAVPEANPALSITCALALTFPFNLVVGIPVYAELAQRLAG